MLIVEYEKTYFFIFSYIGIVTVKSLLTVRQAVYNIHLEKSVKLEVILGKRNQVVTFLEEKSSCKEIFKMFSMELLLVKHAIFQLTSIIWNVSRVIQIPQTLEQDLYIYD